MIVSHTGGLGALFQRRDSGGDGDGDGDDERDGEGGEGDGFIGGDEGDDEQK